MASRPDSRGPSVTLFCTWNFLPLANLLYSFRESNPSGKVIVLVLFVSSIYVWTVMITKRIELGRAQAGSQRFLLAFRKEGNPIGLFLKRHRVPESPLYRVYEKGCIALGGEIDPVGGSPDDLFPAGLAQESLHLNHLQMEGVRNAVERTVADMVLVLENRMSVLATAVTASPFLGLLGTVWGVMEAFGGMAQAGNAQLSAVAPGIAGALLTTVVGLLVALPSAIGYNFLTARVRHLYVETDNFSQEFIAELQRHFLRDR